MNSEVGVIVVTYNSSPFIVETLESVLEQTWNDIELIITDDCSKDDTVEVCRNWLNIHKSRFTRSEIITSEKNRGVSANINRGLAVSKSDWVTFPAGDDTLKPNCIKDNMSWIRFHPEIKVLFSCVEIYDDIMDTEKLIGRVPKNPYNSNSIMAHGRSVDSQYKMLLLSDRINYTPSAFLNREVILSVGGFDERFRMLEDYPMWLNLTKNGYRLYFLDKVTVNYRQHSGAINNTGNKFLINPNYFRQEYFRKLYIYPNLPLDLKFSAQFTWCASQAFRWNWLNKNKKLNRLLHSLLTIYINPFKYYIWIKKYFIRNLKHNEFYM